MEASKGNPVYSTYVVSGNTKYNISPIVQNIDISDPEKEWACRVTLEVVDYQEDGMQDILKARNRVYLYANDGSGEQEVFRGFIWTCGSGHTLTDKTVKVVCYDQLIFMQKSDEALFYPEGKSTKAIFSEVCSKWGISLSYGYQSITHSKLVLRGKLSDIMTADVLDLVKDRSGKKYVILSKKDVMYVSGLGQNSTVYRFNSSENAIRTYAEQTMEGMVTKVVILGKAEKDNRPPVEATISGDTATYGTLQETITRDSNTTLADAKAEANNIIKEKGKPFWEYELRAPDVPWIRKGDKVQVNVDNMPASSFIVKSVERSISNKSKLMSMTLEKA